MAEPPDSPNLVRSLNVNLLTETLKDVTDLDDRWASSVSQVGSTPRHIHGSVSPSRRSASRGSSRFSPRLHSSSIESRTGFKRGQYVRKGDDMTEDNEDAYSVLSDRLTRVYLSLVDSSTFESSVTPPSSASDLSSDADSHTSLHIVDNIHGGSSLESLHSESRHDPFHRRNRSSASSVPSSIHTSHTEQTVSGQSQVDTDVDTSYSFTFEDDDEKEKLIVQSYVEAKLDVLRRKQRTLSTSQNGPPTHSRVTGAPATQRLTGRSASSVATPSAHPAERGSAAALSEFQNRLGHTEGLQRLAGSGVESKGSQRYCRRKLNVLRAKRKNSKLLPAENGVVPEQSSLKKAKKKDGKTDKLESVVLPPGYQRLIARNALEKIKAATRGKVHRPSKCSHCRSQMARLNEAKSIAQLSGRLIKDLVEQDLDDALYTKTSILMIGNIAADLPRPTSSPAEIWRRMQAGPSL